MADLSGLDIGYKIRKEKGLTNYSNDDEIDDTIGNEEIEINEIKNNNNYDNNNSNENNDSNNDNNDKNINNNDNNYNNNNDNNHEKNKNNDLIERYSRIGDILFDSGRLGIKNGKGFYSYKTQKNMKPVAVEDKIVENIIYKENLRKKSNSPYSQNGDKKFRKSVNGNNNNEISNNRNKNHRSSDLSKSLIPNSYFTKI